MADGVFIGRLFTEPEVEGTHINQDKLFNFHQHTKYFNFILKKAFDPTSIKFRLDDYFLSHC